MKTYVSQRSILLPDSNAWQQLLQQTDECTRRYQEYQQQNKKRPREQEQVDCDASDEKKRSTVD